MDLAIHNIGHDKTIVDNQKIEGISMVVEEKTSDCKRPKRKYKKNPSKTELKNNNDEDKINIEDKISQKQINKKKQKKDKNIRNEKNPKKQTKPVGECNLNSNNSVDDNPNEPQIPPVLKTSVAYSLEDNMVSIIKKGPGHKEKGKNDEKIFSQKSQHKKRQVLSQPHNKLSHKERLIWLQERREIGVWVQCSQEQCQKWRYLDHIKDPLDVPKLWYCKNNPNLKFNNCGIKEVGPNECEEEDMIHSKYTAGSIVWARISGYPWWPAMVDDCPDTEQYYWLDGFSDLPTHYNVVFFDSEPVTRAWIALKFMKPFSRMVCNKDVGGKFYHRITAAMTQAENASKYRIKDRLKYFSFLSMYKGKIVSPRNVKAKSNGGRKPLKRNLADDESSSSDSSVDFTACESAGENYDKLSFAMPKCKKNIKIPTKKHGNVSVPLIKNKKKIQGQNCEKIDNDACTQLTEKTLNDFGTCAKKESSIIIRGNLPTVSNLEDAVQSSSYANTWNNSQMNDVAGRAVPAERDGPERIYRERSVISPILSACAKQPMLNNQYEYSTFQLSPRRQGLIPPKTNAIEPRPDISHAAHLAENFIYEASELQYSINFAFESVATNDRMYLTDQTEGLVPSTEEVLKKLDLKQFSEVSNGSGDFEF